jgi:hypothetical protein
VKISIWSGVSVSTSSAPASIAASATSSGSTPSRPTVMRPRGSNCQATAPEPASAPPDFVNIDRTSAAVRLRLSVWASTSTATPPGP